MSHRQQTVCFYLKKEVKKYILSMNFYILNSFCAFKFHIAKMHISYSFSETNTICFDKKINLYAISSEMMQKCDASQIFI